MTDELMEITDRTEEYASCGRCDNGIYKGAIFNDVVYWNFVCFMRRDMDETEIEMAKEGECPRFKAKRIIIMDDEEVME